MRNNIAVVVALLLAVSAGAVAVVAVAAAAAAAAEPSGPKSIVEALREQTEIPPLDYHQVPHHITNQVAETLFGEFIAKHAKDYQSEQERAYRLRVFTDNLHFMAKHNKAAEQGKYTFTVGITPFADLTNQEFIDGYLMNNITHVGGDDDDEEDNDEDDNIISGVRYQPLGDAALPSVVDWRSKGCVGPVRNQANCGSCWAFAAAALIEGAYAQKTGKLLDLSEQQMVDCDTASQGCIGGWVDKALVSVIVRGGIMSETVYPYCACSGGGRTCRFNKLFSAASISTYTIVTNSGLANEAAIQNAVAQRCGVSVYIYGSAPEFQHYTGGVFDLATCPPWVNHAVTAVGYIQTWPSPFSSLPPVWIVRNSWGSGWGVNGNVYMAKDKNMCGIGRFSFYANA